MEEKVRIHIFISGRVQGVFFRQRTKKKADEFRVFGWAKNLSDGRVEAVFEGEKDDAGKLLEWAKRGPKFARVEHLEEIREDYKGEFNGFETR
jgi:acylphosphatase